MLKLVRGLLEEFGHGLTQLAVVTPAPFSSRSRSSLLKTGLSRASGS